MGFTGLRVHVAVESLVLGQDLTGLGTNSGFLGRRFWDSASVEK